MSSQGQRITLTRFGSKPRKIVLLQPPFARLGDTIREKDGTEWKVSKIAGTLIVARQRFKITTKPTEAA
jgi:ABC-type uncharacterized transport system YnjBCD ATPase subunit